MLLERAIWRECPAGRPCSADSKRNPASGGRRWVAICAVPPAPLPPLSGSSLAMYPASHTKSLSGMAAGEMTRMLPTPDLQQSRADQ